MSDFQIAIQVLQDYHELVSEEWLREIVERTLAVESVASPAAVSVVIAGDDVVRELNKRHRGLDETTDVLSFSNLHQGEYHGEGSAPAGWSADVKFVLPPGEQEGLGEVIISYPQAKRQAEQLGHTVQEEMALLLTHGILHLLGHDHMEHQDRVAMEAEEARILAQVNEQA